MPDGFVRYLSAHLTHSLYEVFPCNYIYLYTFSLYHILQKNKILFRKIM